MMDFAFVRADLSDLSKAFALLEGAAKMLQEKGVNQWQCWLSPSASDIDSGDCVIKHHAKGFYCRPNP